MWPTLIGLVLATVGCADHAPAAPLNDATPAITTIPAGGPVADDTGDGTLPPVAPAGTLAIAPAPALQQARYHHAAALVTVAYGPTWVLVSGGENGTGGALAHAERFDTATGLWSDAGTAGAPSARTRHSATSLGNGTVLLAGGHTGGNGPALATAEIYVAADDEFRLIASMTVPRTGHTATRLPDGRVLITGGYDASGLALTSCELFLPDSETFVATPARLSVARAHHAATLLADQRRVLISGGLSSARHEQIRVHGSADLWHSATDIREAAPMAAPRAEHSATLLPNGLVLLAGGSADVPDRHARDDAELFDASPAAGPGGMFAQVTARMASARTGHTATLVPGSNIVLLIGGATEPHPELCPVTVGIERFVPDAFGTSPDAPFQGTTETALFVQPLAADGAPIGLPETAQGLTAHVALALPNGQVLIAGGADCAFARPVAVARTALATDAAASAE